MVVLLGILSAFSFGIGDFLARFSSQEVGFKNSLFWMLIVGAIFYIILFSIFGSGLNPNSIGLSNSFLSGILIMFGLLCLYRGLQMGPVSIVAPIAAINPLFVFLIRYALGSEPTLLQWMATIVVISGAILVSVSADSHQESLGLNKQQIKESVFTSFIASVTLALGLIFSQEATNTLEPLETVIYIRFFSLIGIASILLFSKSKIFITKKAMPILFFQGILETTGYFCLVSAYAFDKVSIAVVISSGFGLVTVVLARLILKEKISKIQGSGIFLTFLGVIGLTI
ncbi:MAG: DMT family transporter [alpha proteobacterium HIMB59]|jgi:drug/metabolite transporter (DMT)-like permease|nr:MAG: DMT family transporter [alpha proteobacterium HIMB59]|tara:strand:+ start:1830 stop:2684 length:855 start_codon:yes stop_codon:yes gene_type:complete